jgi:hypothetical protein
LATICLRRTWTASATVDGDGKDDDARLILVVGEHRATVVLSGRQAALD